MNKKSVPQLFLCLIVLLASCNTEKQVAGKLYKLYVKNEVAVARLCADLYPPIEKVVDTVIYKKGIPMSTAPTFRVIDCDSVIRKTKKRHVSISIPGNTIVTDTVVVYKERQLVNNAKLIEYEAQYKELDNELVKCRIQKKWLLNVLAILCIYTLARWLLRYWNIRLP